MKRGLNLLFLTLLIALDVQAASALTYDIALIMRRDDKELFEDDTREKIIQGINTAKELFESKYKVKINLVPYYHSRHINSVSETAEKITKRKFHAVIGGETSNHAIVISDILEKKGYLYITPTATNPQVTKDKKFTFRGCFDDIQAAKKLADFTAKTLKPSALGVLRNTSRPYPNFLTLEFLKNYRKISPKALVIEKRVLKTASHYKDEIEEFKKKGVTHVSILSFQGDLMQFVKDAEKMDFFPVYIGADGWGSSEYLIEELVNSYKEGKKFIAYRSMYWHRDDRKVTKDFIKSYKKKYSTEPNSLSAMGYDTAWVLFSALRKATDPSDPNSVKKAMYQLKDLDLVTTQSFRFYSKNTPNKDLHIFKLSKNGINYEATIK